jgi:hypothetical protein
MGRQMGFVPMVFFGQWGMPFGVPKSRPLTVVVGTPLEAPKRGTSSSSSNSTSAEQRDSKIATPATATPAGAVDAPLLPKGHLYDPTDEEIDSFLAAFIVALEKLYSEHSEQYGMGHIKLVIV